MVIIENFFIHYKQPSQYIYAGEKYLDIYKSREKGKGKGLVKSRTLEDTSMFNLDADGFGHVAAELEGGEVGLILNSGYFIFNLFDFEQLPLREATRKEIVEWRLKKVFPENLGDYDHQYFQIARNKILSVLFKREIKEKLEGLFSAHQLELTYMGNSTMNVLNRLTRQRRYPEFLLEIDRNLSLIAFLDRGRPYYIRKFRAEREPDAVAEILKTVNYVKTSYSKTPRSYAIFAGHSDLDLHFIRDGLAKHEINQMQVKKGETAILPG